ncbi:MAG: class I SAM-dependent methyltransferase [Verrucomicrobiales bacterium]|nr:class I SAM-dependent methyltransferase [Verrucomicrobiales bacterium]
MTDEEPASDGRNEQNKSAWDSLYAQTDGPVWGDPIPFVKEFAEKLAEQFSADSKLLDAAAGEGRHTPLLIDLPGETYACDGAEHALEKLQTLSDNLKTRLCDLSETGFEDGQFDFVLLIDTIETLPNVEKGMAEMNRILKPGGLLLCNIPGEEDNIAGENMEDCGVPDEDSYWYDDRYYYRFFEEEEAIQMVNAAGFSVVENVMRTWTEKPHPHFREKEHDHTSRVFLLKKRG